jgi:hypothetical protein
MGRRGDRRQATGDRESSVVGRQKRRADEQTVSDEERFFTSFRKNDLWGGSNLPAHKPFFLSE